MQEAAGAKAGPPLATEWGLGLMLPAHFQVFASHSIDLMQRRAPVLLVLP